MLPPEMGDGSQSESQPTHRAEPRLTAFLAAHDAPCPGCGYNLRGLSGDACPECGVRLDSVDLALFRHSVDELPEPQRRKYLGRGPLEGMRLAAAAIRRCDAGESLLLPETLLHPGEYTFIRGPRQIRERVLRPLLMAVLLVLPILLLLALPISVLLKARGWNGWAGWTALGLMMFAILALTPLWVSMSVFLRRRRVRVAPDGSSVQLRCSVAGAPVLSRTVSAEEIAIRLYPVALFGMRARFWRGYCLILSAEGFYVPLSRRSTAERAVEDVESLCPALRARYLGIGPVILARTVS